MNRRQFLSTMTTATCAALGAAMPTCAANDIDIELKIGQMLMVNFYGVNPVDSNIARLVRTGRVGGVLLFEHNFASASSPRESLIRLAGELQEASPEPLLIAIDQEGGAVNRLKQRYGFPATLSAAELGRRNDLTFTYNAAEKMAATLAELGVNHNFAPVVDVNVNPQNPVVGRRGRCFSDDPSIVAAHAAAFIRAHRAHHVLTTLKHFPGHGSSAADSHKGLTDVTATWSERELVPYKLLLQKGLVDAIMTAHIFNANLDAEHPASLSKKTITGLLRNKLGYDGVVISDDLLMGAVKNQYTLEESVTLAVNAGVDILMFTSMEDDLVGRVSEIIKKQAARGIIASERIDESARRISRLKQALS